jgi:hypothetical protein
MRNAGAAVIVLIWLCALSRATAQTVGNSSFETPSLPANSFSYDPSGGTWTFAANAGIINAPGGGFVGPSAPDGSQYAFLQSANNPGALSQSITFSLAGTYQLSYLVAARSDNGLGAAGNLSYQVLLDSTVIGNDATVSGQPFTSRSFNFVASSGSHTLTFEPIANEVDNTAFLDVVAIQPVPEPAAGGLLLSSLSAFLVVRALRRERNQ